MIRSRLTRTCVPLLGTLMLFAACKSANQPPDAPVLLGPATENVGTKLSYSVSSVDPDGDMVAYRVAWGDGDTTDWSQPLFSGETLAFTHSWSVRDTYQLSAQAKDQRGNESPWSGKTLDMQPPDYPDTVIATINTGGTINSVVGLASHPYVYITNEIDGVYVINTAELRVVDTIVCGDDAWQLTASPDDRYVYVNNHYGNTVQVIETATNTVVATIPVGDCPHSMACTPDGERLYVANINDNNVSVIRTSDNTVVDTVAVGDDPRGLCMLPNGEYVYTANSVGSVSVIRTADDSVVGTVPVTGFAHRATSSSDGQYVYISGGYTGPVTVIQTSDNTVVGTLPITAGPVGGCGLPGADYVYIACQNSGCVAVIRTSDNTVADVIRVGADCRTATTSGSGDRVYTADGDVGTVSVLARQ